MNYTKTQINEGLNGSGQKVWVLYTERTGSKGQTIRRQEVFKIKGEAEAYLKASA